MTQAEMVAAAMKSVATAIPDFERLSPGVQRQLMELGEEYFREEFVPRLIAVLNVTRYEESMEESTAAQREYIDDHREFLEASIGKAQRAAQDQLRETYDASPCFGPPLQRLM